SAWPWSAASRLPAAAARCGESARRRYCFAYWKRVGCCWTFPASGSAPSSERSSCWRSWPTASGAAVREPAIDSLWRTCSYSVLFSRLWSEFHRFVDLRHRHVDADLAERQDGIQSLVDFPLKTALGAAKRHDGRGLLLYEHVDAERWNRQIGVLLFSFVKAASPV